MQGLGSPTAEPEAGLGASARTTCTTLHSLCLRDQAPHKPPTPPMFPRQPPTPRTIAVCSLHAHEATTAALHPTPQSSRTSPSPSLNHLSNRHPPHNLLILRPPPLTQTSDHQYFISPPPLAKQVDAGSMSYSDTPSTCQYNFPVG